MEPLTFKYSIATQNEQTKKYRRFLHLISPLFAFGLIFLSPLPATSEADLWSKFSLWVFLSALAELLIWGGFFFWSKMMVGSTIQLQETAIEQKNNKSVEQVPYQEITRLKIHTKYQSDEVIAIELGASGKSVWLYGYKNMPLLCEKILAQIPDKSMVEVKTPRVDWQNPVVLTMMFLVMGLIILGIQFLGELTFEMFFIGVMIVLGLFYLIVQPISQKFGVRFKTLEICLGLMLMGSGGLLLYLKLFLSS